MDKIVVLDFGSQTSALIGRRIRELGVYSELIPGDTPFSSIIPEGVGGVDANGNRVRGIVFSGSPESVMKDGIVPDPKLYSCGLPLLGICYGLQRMTCDNGGLVEAMGEREYGSVEVKGQIPGANETFADSEKLRRFFAAFDPAVSLDTIKNNGASSSAGQPSAKEFHISSWMSHSDQVTRLAPGFRQYGISAAGSPSVLVHESKPWFGVQFHPEVANCGRGLELLAAFVFGVSRCVGEWTMEQYVKEVCAGIAEKVGNKTVLLLISGGVDSTVVAALLLKSLNAGQVHLLYIDTGLMRKNETSTVKVSLERLGAKYLHVINCEEEFLKALKGVEDPEAKRKAIGDLFITIQERETAKLGLKDAFLAQGTIYPDILESGKGSEKNAKVIKSHHNVGSALVDAKRRSGLVIEPLEKLFKDEVRSLGRFLGVDEEVLRRHPFPGPGISVRILGEVTREKCDILREADAIYIEELKKRRGPSGRTLYDEIWQAFPVLLPIRSTGISGDSRNYSRVLALRAITSTDAMTAGVYPFEVSDLLEISARITGKVKEIGRVTYDITSKPPATIEWE